MANNSTIQDVANNTEMAFEVSFEILDKFGPILESIKKQVTFQGGVLKAISETNAGILDVQKEHLSIVTEKIRDDAREERLGDGPVGGTPVSEGRTPDAPAGPTPAAGALNQDFMASIMPGLGTFVGSFLGSSHFSLGGIASLAFKGALFGIIAEPLGQFLGGAAESTLSQLGFDQKFSKDFGDQFADAAKFGIIGSIFSKKLGLLLAGGKLLEPAIIRVLDRDNDGMIEMFGKEFSPEWSEGIGTAIGAAVAFTVLKVVRGSIGAILSRVVPGAIAAATAGASVIPKAGKSLLKGASRLLSLPAMTAALIVTPTAANADEAEILEQHRQVEATMEPLPENPTLEQVEAHQEEFVQKSQEMFPLTEEEKATIKELEEQQVRSERTKRIIAAAEKQAKFMMRFRDEDRLMGQFVAAPFDPTGQTAEAISPEEAARIWALQQRAQESRLDKIEKESVAEEKAKSTVVVDASTTGAPITTTNNNSTVINNNTIDTRRSLDAPYSR